MNNYDLLCQNFYIVFPPPIHLLAPVLERVYSLIFWFGKIVSQNQQNQTITCLLWLPTNLFDLVLKSDYKCGNYLLGLTFLHFYSQVQTMGAFREYLNPGNQKKIQDILASTFSAFAKDELSGLQSTNTIVEFDIPFDKNGK